MQTFELTVEVSNGDWHSTRVVVPSFHEAAAEGLDFATKKQGKLVAIERLPDGTPGRAFKEPG
jgi:hypothetical protein